MWALDLWKYDYLARAHQEFCRRLWPTLGWHMGDHPAWRAPREWCCVGAQGSSGNQGSKLHRVPGSSSRPGCTPWALHPLVVAAGDAPEFPE